MKINLTTVAAALALVALAYTLGKRKGAVVQTATADANIQQPQQWWNYAGLWSQ